MGYFFLELHVFQLKTHLQPKKATGDREILWQKQQEAIEWTGRLSLSRQETGRSQDRGDRSSADPESGRLRGAAEVAAAGSHAQRPLLATA